MSKRYFNKVFFFLRTRLEGCLCKEKLIVHFRIGNIPSLVESSLPSFCGIIFLKKIVKKNNYHSEVQTDKDMECNYSFSLSGIRLP